MSKVAHTPSDCSHAVLRSSVFPWVIASAIAIVGGFAACLLSAAGVLDQQTGTSSVLFFSILAGGFVPRAMPAVVELQLNSCGFTVRDICVSEHYRWDDVTSPFTVTTTLFGDAVSFTRKNHAPRAPLFCRAMLRDTYGLSAKALADLLNRWRQDALRSQNPDNRV